MTTPDEPRISFPVQAYIDREIERAVKQIERQFVTVEVARVIARDTLAAKGSDAAASGRFAIERVMAGLALLVAAVSLFLALSK